MRLLQGLALVVFAALMLWVGRDLPHMADPDSPASTYVAAEYVERSLRDTHTPNVVTAVLADYRGFDTLGETTVVFTAMLACLLVLRGREPDGEDA